MEELNGVRDAVLDEHPLRISRDEGGASELEIVGKQEGRILVAELRNGHLTKFALVAFQMDPLFQHFRSSEGAGQGF